jgi:hypothetical protein
VEKVELFVGDAIIKGKLWRKESCLWEMLSSRVSRGQVVWTNGDFRYRIECCKCFVNKTTHAMW